jgi:hypothetical protein
MMGALPDIGGVSTLFVGDHILVKNQYEARQNGIYNIDLGSSGSYWKLTRSADSAKETEIVIVTCTLHAIVIAYII